MDYVGVAVLVALAVVFVSKTWSLIATILWRPYVLTRFFEKQGIRGPPYSLLYGSLAEMKKLKRAAYGIVLDTDSHDFIPKVIPHYHKWCSQYGERVLYWYGTQPRITIADLDVAKQVLINKFDLFVKPAAPPALLKFSGRGLVFVEGQVWARQRKVLNPAFSMDTLKVLVKRMGSCTISTIKAWENQIVLLNEGKAITIEMNMEFQKLAADIIANTAFGINYSQGKEAFIAQKELQKYSLPTFTDIHVPFSEYLPTPSNLRIWKLDRKLKKTLHQIVESRVRSLQTDPEGSQCDDLLGIMIGSSSSTNQRVSSSGLKMEEVMENCKSFFFAGHETTAALLTWVMFLLCLYQDWQEKLREEVLQECKGQVPDANMLTKLKLVNMVLLETLRLYPPTEIFREATENIKLGNLTIPKGTCVAIQILKIHRSKTYWGEDANEFNPMRFENGVSKAAKHPNAMLGFSLGPRYCIGQNFTMMESKMLLALLLQKFSFSLSPEYKHAPIDFITLCPQHGLPVIVKLLSS